MIKLLRETPLKSGETRLLVKKGKMYLTIRNNELAKSAKQANAIVFTSAEEIERFLDNACIDDRNARVIGNGYSIVPITRP